MGRFYSKSVLSNAHSESHCELKAQDELDSYSHYRVRGCHILLQVVEWRPAVYQDLSCRARFFCW